MAQAGSASILIQHFFGRFFDKESLSPQADPAANLGPLLGLLAAPGAFFVILLQVLTLTGWDLVFFRYFFLSFSMVAMAFIVVLKWDALFPDLRDYQILTPLPLSPARLLFTKMTALALFLGMFLLDLNLFAVLCWPGIDRGRDSLTIIAAHAMAMGAGGLFAAFAAASVQGILMNVLSTGMFRRVAAVVQTALMAVLVMMLFLTPLIAMLVRGLVKARSPLLYWFPGFWFLGLYERLRPATHDPVLLDLGRIGMIAFWVSAALFLATYLPGYRRHARRVLEKPLASPSGPGPVRRALGTMLDRRLLPAPVERGVFHFISQTMTRSMKHRIFLATYGGLGAALGVTTLFSGESGLLRLPLTLSFVLVSALRAAFSFPSELGANWTFQITEMNSAAGYVAAMRKWVVACTIVPMFVLLSPMEFVSFGLSQALFHIAFGVILSLLLIEILFAGFRKVAFTCAYFPGRINLVGLSAIYIFGFTAYSDTMSGLEQWLGRFPSAAMLFLLAGAATVALLARTRDRRLQRVPALDYQGASDPVVRTIGLAAR